MARISIFGGKKIKGEVKISGSKNAALPILAATIMLSGETTITNVPHLLDVITMLRVLRAVGLRAEYHEPNIVKIWNNNVKHVAPYELVTKMRASFFIIGPILARKGLAKVPLPGGCAIGSRPVDIHIKGMQALGAKVRMEHGFVIVQADRLVGNRIYLDFPSVGATEAIMMAASLAEGTTLIENPAREPEIVDLADFLNAAGAIVEGAGTEIIKITGVRELRGIEYKIIPDRIEAGTFMVASAITDGDLNISGIIPQHLESFSAKLAETGASISFGPDSVKVKANGSFKPTNIKTLPFPGFPTDLQPQITPLLSIARGTSIITETVFENRFMHIQELKRMGANIRIEGRSAVVDGIRQLSGAPVTVSDLRAGAALVIAALSADGETIIDDTERHIARGYDRLTDKLVALGAEISEI